VDGGRVTPSAKEWLVLEAVAPVTRLEVPVACRERSLDA
jgi:hypothetical protein